jgi:hypothetical protein
MSVMDGESAWVFSSELKQFARVKPSKPGEMLQPGSPLASETVIGEYQALPQRVRSATWLRTEQLRLDGRDVLCDVVEIDFKPDAAGVISVERGVLWVARDLKAVLKETRTLSGKMKSGSTSVATTTTSFSVVRFNPRISADEFKFVPPPGAKEVESLPYLPVRSR